jgi:hypothetical protein
VELPAPELAGLEVPVAVLIGQAPRRRDAAGVCAAGLAGLPGSG